MKRRTLVILLGMVAAFPLSAPAAQFRELPTLGFLSTASPKTYAHLLKAFSEGLRETGYVNGQNIHIEYRWAENHYDRLPDLAAQLVRRRPAIIVASGGHVAALAAKRATRTIPIVFTAVSNPVKLGLVASLNRPGGNLTGIQPFTVGLDAKRISLLCELVPSVSVIGVVINPNHRDDGIQLAAVETAAQQFGRRLVLLKVGAERDFDSAFERIPSESIGAIAVAADPFLNSLRTQLVQRIARYRVPAIYQWREFVEAGGLMSYGTSLPAVYREAGRYAGRILNGMSPSELPVQQATKFELVVNMKTARTLGITIPRSILLRADKVIE